jgi:hypothetical protein
MGIDITITATSRPDILRSTLTSFCANLFRPHMNIIHNVFINIDPIGPGTQQDTLAVCREFFPGRIITAHLSDTASFPKAFVWCWQQTLSTNSSCVFHLEDDWELLESVDLRELFLLLYLYPDLSVLRLSAFQSGTHIMKCWDKFISWNGTFFEIPPNLRGLLGFCGHPSLIRKEFIQTVLPHIDDTKNPEKQIKGVNKQFGNYILSHRFGVYQHQDSPAIIRDIGRQWMTKHGYRKSGSKAWFTQWESDNPENSKENPKSDIDSTSKEPNILKLVK